MLIKLNADKLNNRGPKVDKKKGVLANYKCHMLLLFYMCRAEGIPERYKEEVSQIVQKIPSLIDLWLEISMFFHVNYARKVVRKNIPFKTVVDLMNFSQHVIQGMWEKDSELMQLPHINTNASIAIQKKMKKKTVSLKEYVELSPEERKSHGVLKDAEMEHVEKWIKNLPKIKFSSKLYTDGFEDIIGGDLVTVSVSIDREDLSVHDRVPPICSTTYPFSKTPTYHIFITDKTEKMIMGNMKLTGTTKVLTSEIKLPTPPTTNGECMLKIFCFVDSYIGFDQSTELKFTVTKYDEERDTFKYHEDDIKRDPSLFEQALQGLKEQNSDDELESDSDDDKGFGSKKHLSKKSSDDEIDDEKDD
mmetsp:Transcript_25676/g.25479  ORF Transcript_25676/g.25479 Transcript_25676/m.25479 type:complete len:361 (-) Transcript_25676:21-1103(-)